MEDQSSFPDTLVDAAATCRSAGQTGPVICVDSVSVDHDAETQLVVTQPMHLASADDRQQTEPPAPKRKRDSWPLFKPTWMAVSSKGPQLPVAKAASQTEEDSFRPTPSILKMGLEVPDGWGAGIPVRCDRCGWRGKVRANLGSTLQPFYGYCSNFDESEQTQCAPCYGELLGDDGLAPALTDARPAQLGLAPLAQQSSLPDSGEPDSLELLLGVPVTSKAQRLSMHRAWEWHRLVQEFRSQQDESSSDEIASSDSDEGEKMQCAVDMHSLSMSDGNIWWRNFHWEFLDLANLCRCMNIVGVVAEQLVMDPHVRMAYAGLTRDPLSRYRGVSGRPDIKPHVRSFSAMHVLCVGYDIHVARLERGLIKRLEKTALESGHFVLANRGPGGEGARRRVKTFLYVCLATTADELACKVR